MVDPLPVFSAYVLLMYSRFPSDLLKRQTGSDVQRSGLSSATITVAYMVLIVKDERNWKKALSLGRFILLLVIPTLIYSQWFLASTSPEVDNRALEILVVERIPYHSLPLVWFNYTVLLRLLLVTVALCLLRRTELIWIL